MRLSIVYIIYIVFLSSCNPVIKNTISVSGLDSTSTFSPPSAITPFVSTWRTTGASETIILPLRAGYSYDFTISRLVTNTGGAHEVSLIYKFDIEQKKKFKPIPCPEF